MQQALQLMPEKCSRCGALFDLGYDLGTNKERFDEALSALTARKKKMLCWTCRE